MPFIPDKNKPTPGFISDKQITSQKKQPGFFKGLVQDIARPFLRTGVTGVAAAKGITGLIRDDVEQQKRAVQDVDLGFFGIITPVGREAETIGEFAKDVIGTGAEVGSIFAGGAGVAAGGRQLLKGTLGRAIKTGVKTGAQAGFLGAGGRALQEQKTLGKTVLQAGIGTVGGGVVGGTLGAGGVAAKIALTPIKTITTRIAPALQKLGTRIETALIKPVKRELEKGFKSENVFKHNIGGTLQNTYNKSTALLANLRSQARKLREGTEEVIDVEKIMNNTVDELEKSGGKLFGIRGRINKAVGDFIKEFEQITPTGKLTVPQAQEIKEATGAMGSWLYGSRDLDANATEKVANVIYTNLKTQIEKNSGKGLAQINKAMSEIIPIKNAVIRRIPIAERGSIISISDILTAGFSLQNPKGWGLFLLNRLSKSGRVAATIFKAGKKLEKIKPPIEIIKGLIKK